MKDLFEIATLKNILSTLLQCSILDVAYSIEELQGGTVASVYLVSGSADSADGSKHPFKVVLKTQKKWERYRDRLSWRREFDLYRSDLAQFFSDAFKWPICYHSEINDTEDEIRLWLEYIDGTTGEILDKEMLEKAAYALGAFQGKTHLAEKSLSDTLTNLSTLDYAKNFYEHYRSWPVVHDYIRSSEVKLPKHLCDMLIEFDDQATDHFNKIEKLPVVLCHRDYWIANVFYKDQTIYAIDWDTAGWGYLGEDIASLIADEADNAHMVENYTVLVSAYYKGFSDQTGIAVEHECIFPLILAMFGYRLIEWYLMSPSAEKKNIHLKTLENLYAIKNLIVPIPEPHSIDSLN